MSDPNALQKTLRQWSIFQTMSASSPQFIEARLLGLISDVFRTAESFQSREQSMLRTIARAFYEGNNFPAYSEEGDQQIDAMLRENQYLRNLAIAIYKRLMARFNAFLEQESKKSEEERIQSRLDRLGNFVEPELNASPSMEEMVAITISNTAMMMTALASRFQVQGTY
jgi:hypothetical protein